MDATALHVACSADARYLPHAATMLRSVLAHSDGLQIHVHLLHGPGLPPQDVHRVGVMVEGEGASFQAHAVGDEQIDGLPGISQAGIPSTIWYRIYLPQLLPDVDRILYLDGDLLAVDSLAPLAAVEIGGHYVGAVTNVFEPWNEGYPAALGLDLKGPRSYFNSGVLLMNLALMRSDGCTAALREWALANHDRLPWGDQDALNAVLAGKRVELHPRWNCMNSVMRFESAADVFGVEATEEARRRPGIRHFEGPGENKPWHLLAEPPARAEYLRHRRGTPWPRPRPEGLTPRNMVKRVVRDLRDRG